MDSNKAHGIGGKARAEALSPERRAEIAGAGGAARWRKPEARRKAALATLRRRMNLFYIARRRADDTMREMTKAMDRVNQSLAALDLPDEE